jgi:hypothetical protein
MSKILSLYKWVRRKKFITMRGRGEEGVCVIGIHNSVMTPAFSVPI